MPTLVNFYWWSGEIFHNAAGCLEAAKADYEKALSTNPVILLPGRDWHGSTDAAANTMKP